MKLRMIFCWGLLLGHIVFVDCLPAQDNEAGHRILEYNTPTQTVGSNDTVSPSLDPAVTSSDAGEKVDRLLTLLVLDHIPHQYAKAKNWGNQEERWDGVDFRREGFKIETKRRKKMVNHGTWKKYSARLLNPAEEFAMEVKNMRELDEGKFGFDVYFTSHIALQGRQAKWMKGVQLYSLSVSGHTKVRLMVGIELAVTTDVSRFPPDMIFRPVAKTALIEVDDFRIDRVSKIGGEVAQQVTKGVRSLLDEQVAEKEVELVEKINKSLRTQDLRLSVGEALKSKWADLAKPFMEDSK